MDKAIFSTLQKEIEKRAGQRLDADLKAVSQFIRGNRLFSETGMNCCGDRAPWVHIGRNPDAKGNFQQWDETTPYWLFRFEQTRYEGMRSSIFMDRLREYWLPIYVEEETREFFENFEKTTAKPETETQTED